jgi:FkbM family methyltransferase
MNIHEWIIKNLNRNSIIVEAGTADGADTLFFSHYFNEGKVYGFEPIANLYYETLSKVNTFSNVELINAALSEKTGKEKIYVSDRFGKDWGSSSILKPKDHLDIHPEITFKNEIEINTINLDDWLNIKNHDNIDLLWLDMQGYEPVVLKSSPETLKRTKYLYTEVSLIETYENVILYPEFKQFLLNNGFVVIDEDLPWKDMGNVLFKNSNLI